MLSTLGVDNPFQSNDSTNSISLDNSLNISLNSNNAGDSSFNSTSSYGSETNGFRNYVGELLEICGKSYLTCNFDIASMSGEPHSPSFTYICKINDRTCEGTALSKQRAKNRAAELMLDIVYNDLIPSNENYLPIAKVRDVEEVLEEYRRIKAIDNNFGTKKSSCKRISRNPFVNVSTVLRERAVKLLSPDDLLACSSVEIINAICKAMELEYEITALPTHPGNTKQLTLKNCATDFVLIEEESVLGTRFFKYCRNMLNVHYGKYDLT